MSDVPLNLAGVLAHVAETFDEPIRNTLNRECPFFSILPTLPYAGEQVDWRITTSGRTVVNPASGADWGANASTDTRRKLTLGWGRYASMAIIGMDALTVAARSPSGAFSALMQEANEGGRAIAKQIDDDLFDGTGSDKIIGIETAIDATGSYAGLHQSDDNAWAASESGNISVTLTEGNLDAALEGVAQTWGAPLGAGDAIVTTYALRSKLKALLTASGNRQHQVVTMAGGQASVTLHGGASGVLFSDVPVIADPDCTTSTMYLVRRSEIVFKYMPFVVPGTDAPVMVPIKDRDGNVTGSRPAMVHVIPLAKTGDHVKFGLLIQGQLQVTHRKAHGKFFASAT